MSVPGSSSLPRDSSSIPLLVISSSNRSSSSSSACPFVSLSPDVFLYLLHYLTPLNAIFLCRSCSNFYPRLWFDSTWKFYNEIRQIERNQNPEGQVSYHLSDLPLSHSQVYHSILHPIPSSFHSFQSILLQESSHNSLIQFQLPLIHYEDSPDQFPTPFSSYTSTLCSVDHEENQIPREERQLSQELIIQYTKEFLRIITDYELNSLFQRWNQLIFDHSVDPGTFRLCWLSCCCCFGVGCLYFIKKAKNTRILIEKDIKETNQKLKELAVNLEFSLTPGATMEGSALIVRFRKKPILLPGYED
jgi:hypothetical protein